MPVISERFKHHQWLPLLSMAQCWIGLSFTFNIVLVIYAVVQFMFYAQCVYIVYFNISQLQLNADVPFILGLRHAEFIALDL